MSLDTCTPGKFLREKPQFPRGYQVFGFSGMTASWRMHLSRVWPPSSTPPFLHLLPRMRSITKKIAVNFPIITDFQNLDPTLCMLALVDQPTLFRYAYHVRTSITAIDFSLKEKLLYTIILMTFYSLLIAKSFLLVTLN